MMGYNIRFFTCIIVFCYAVFSYGQNRTKTISGKVIDFKTKEPIGFVIVNVLFENTYTQTNYKGNFNIDYKNDNPVIVIRKLGYETITLSLDSTTRFPLLINLKTQSKDLSEVVVSATKNATRLVKNDFYVMDYQFINNDIILLGDINEKQYLRLITKEGEVLQNYKLNNDVYKALFKDCFGNIHLTNETLSTQIYMNSNGIGLLDNVRINLFDSLLKPCLLNKENYFYFENNLNSGQTKRFFAIHKSTKQVQDMGSYSDEAMIEMMMSENAFNNNKYGGSDKNEMEDMSPDELRAMRRKEDAATFFKTVVMTTAYIPLYASNDTAYIFNHPNNLIHSYSLVNNMPLQIKTMEYNHFKNWKPMVICDATTHKFYTTYLHDGIITLGEINVNNGKINKKFTLKHAYPKTIKIDSGIVYYMYRVKFTLDKMALYSHKIE